MKLAEINVRGQRFVIHVTEDGEFSTTFDGTQIRSTNLKELEEKLMNATKVKRINVAIEFYRFVGGNVVHGVLTGIHAGNNNLLIRWDGKKGVEQESSYSWHGRGDKDFLRLTEAEVNTYKELCEAYTSASKRREVFENAHALNPKEEIEAQVKAYIAAKGESE